MKTNCWLILGTMLATTAVAQVNTNKLPEIPPPAMSAPATTIAPVETKASAPAKKATVKAKKKVVKKAKVAAKPVAKKVATAPVALVPGQAIVTANNVNLRGQAGLKGEVVGHVQKGDAVTVISQINLDKPKTGEPAQWAKVELPSGTKVWIDSKFTDTTNNVVKVKKLNLRGGPGENYSVLGVVEKGAAFVQVTSKGDWMQIETPTNAFAFVAASYLKQEVPGMDTSVPVVAAVEPVAPTTATVADAQNVSPATGLPVTPDTSVSTPPTTSGQVMPALIVPPPALASDIDTSLPPPPPRIVTHEGTVRRSVSPVAPTYYELYDPADGKAINYLFATTTNLNLSRYNGLHITVTGEEGLAARWHDTPVLTIQKIYVISGNVSANVSAPEPKLTPVASPNSGTKPPRRWYHLWLW